VRPPSFSEPETATPTAKEIMERIDKIFREAKISERRKEIKPIRHFFNLGAICTKLSTKSDDNI
jgi:hypothetical protein